MTLRFWRSRAGVAAYGDPAERPPRLVLRFAVLTAVSLGLAAAAILVLMRHVNTAQAERTAARQASFLADVVLRDELKPADLQRPVRGTRRAELDRFFQRKVLLGGTLLVTLSRRDGVITYATNHALIGSRRPNADARRALDGTITSDVASLADRGGGSTKVLESFVPVTAGKSRAVAAVSQDYGPIESAARAAFLPVAGVLELVLVLLFLLLVPVLARVSRRIQRQLQKITHQAYFDELTDLPNRTLFRHRIEEAIGEASAAGSCVAVLLLDLDRFKEINDTLGHRSGDKVLRVVGARLSMLDVKPAILARLGGDEFGILMTVDADAALSAARLALEALKEPFEVEGIPLAVETSIGIAVFPEHGTDVDALLQRADVAMYAAKHRRAGVAIYDPQSDPNDPDRLKLGGELGRALDHNELVCHYQPKIDLASGRIVGVETLVRWQHPERGLLPPSEFMPFAERTGLIRPLSRYVLERAIRQCSAWQKVGVDIHVAVNLTMHDLVDVELPGEIATLLAAATLRPALLELEITETSIMADPFRVRHVLMQLSEMGIRIAIDDFGTGYSSLGYLKRLPVDELKIDRSFVMTMTSDASDATIVRSTVDLGRNLGLTVVAEGVETADTLECLKELGCDIVQGYFTGRPVIAEELTPTLLAESKVATLKPRSRPQLVVTP